MVEITPPESQSRPKRDAAEILDLMSDVSVVSLFQTHSHVTWCRHPIPNPNPRARSAVGRALRRQEPHVRDADTGET